jgi:hypothetical protein
LAAAEQFALVAAHKVIFGAGDVPVELLELFEGHFDAVLVLVEPHGQNNLYVVENALLVRLAAAVVDDVGAEEESVFLGRKLAALEHVAAHKVLVADDFDGLVLELAVVVSSKEVHEEKQAEKETRACFH